MDDLDKLLSQAESPRPVPGYTKSGYDPTLGSTPPPRSVPRTAAPRPKSAAGFGPDLDALLKQAEGGPKPYDPTIGSTLPPKGAPTPQTNFSSQWDAHVAETQRMARAVGIPWSDPSHGEGDWHTYDKVVRQTFASRHDPSVPMPGRVDLSKEPSMAGAGFALSSQLADVISNAWTAVTGDQRLPSVIHWNHKPEDSPLANALNFGNPLSATASAGHALGHPGETVASIFNSAKRIMAGQGNSDDIVNVAIPLMLLSHGAGSGLAKVQEGIGHAVSSGIEGGAAGLERGSGMNSALPGSDLRAAALKWAQEHGAEVVGEGHDGKPIIRIKAQGRESSPGATGSGAPGGARSDLEAPLPHATHDEAHATGPRRAIVNVNDRQFELTGKALEEYERLKASHDTFVKSRGSDPDGQASIKAAGMRFSADVRELVGARTAKEEADLVQKAGQLGLDTPVKTPLGEGVVSRAPAFGNVKVRYADGAEATHPVADVTSTQTPKLGPSHEGVKEITAAAEAPTQTPPQAPANTGKLPDGATGARNAVVTQERTARGEEPVQLGPAQGRESGYEAARAKVDAQDIDPRQIAEDVASGKRTASAEDTHALAYDRARIKARYDALSKQIEEAIADDDLPSAAELHRQRDAVQEAFDKNDRALIMAGRQWHEAGLARQSIVLRDFSSPQSMLAEYQRAVGRPLKPAEKAEIQELAGQHQKLSEQISELQAENQRLKDAAAARQQLRATAQAARGARAKVLDQEWANLKRELSKGGGGGTRRAGRSRSGGAVYIPLDKASVIRKMVDNRIKRYGVSLEVAAAHVHTLIEKHLPGIAVDDVVGAYHQFLGSPEGKLRAKRGGIRNRLNDLIETARADGRIGKFATELGRMNALSSVNVFGKLGAATAGHAVITPIEELLGPAIGKLPGLKGAGTESAFSPKAVGKFLQEFVNPASVKDAFRKLFTGLNSLDARAADLGITGEKHTSNVILRLFQNSHGAMKTLAQRASFAKEFVKGLQEAKKAGKDLADPDVQAQAFAEAYGASKRDIFMGDSAQAKLVQGITNPSIENGPIKSGLKIAARVAMPVVRVPLNYAGRALEYTFGPVYAPARHLAELAFHGNKIPVEAKQNIIRAYKRAGVGAGLALTAYYLGKDQVAVNEKDHLVLFGKELPTWASHIPWFEALKLGALFRDGKGPLLKRAYDASFQTGKGIVTHTPLFDVPNDIVKAFKDQASLEDAAGAYLRGYLEPQLMQMVVRNQDVDASGKPVQRKASGIKEQLQLGAPQGTPIIGGRRDLHERMTLESSGVRLSEQTSKEVARLGIGWKPPKQGASESDADYHKRVNPIMQKFAIDVDKMITRAGYKALPDTQPKGVPEMQDGNPTSKTAALNMLRRLYGLPTPD